jgi:hypothetical protein
VRADARLITSDAVKTLMDVAVRKLDDGSVAKALTRSSNSQTLSNLVSLFTSSKGDSVPTNSTAVVYNSVFIAAAITLLVAFGLLYHVVHKLKLFMSTTEEKSPGRVVAWWAAINVTFLISALLWLLGFCLVIADLAPHFEHADMSTWFSVFVPLYLKVVASVMLSIQPLTALLTQQNGVAWANNVGVVLFHLGNLMTLFSGLASAIAAGGNVVTNFFDVSTDAKKNVLMHIFYTMGTTLLLTGGHMFSDKVEHGPVKGIYYQLAGSGLLLLGCIAAMALSMIDTSPKADATPKSN